MRRDRIRLERLPLEQGHCPVPGLLVSGRWHGPRGDWWAGALIEGPVRVVAAPVGRLDLTGPGGFTGAHDAFRPRSIGDLLRVTGAVTGSAVEGVVEQPGTRGFLKNLTAVSRERKRVRLQLTDGREWWLRANGTSTVTVTDADGRFVGSRTGGPVELAATASELDHLVALLLITGIERDGLLVIGTIA